MSQPAQATQFAADFSIQSGAAPNPSLAYVWFPGNMIAPTLMAMVPEWRVGGLHNPNIITLGYRNGYIRRGEIVECRQTMVGRRAGNVLPSERKHMVRAYVENVNGQQRLVNHPGKTADQGMLFKPWYPVQDLAWACAEGTGLVELPITSAADAQRAQYFVFPNWDAIVAGNEFLPAKLKDLRYHLEGRLSEAIRFSDPMLQAVLRQMIIACDRFEAAGRAEATRQTAMFNEAEKKGWNWTYGLDAELYMEQLGIQRRDNIRQDEGNQIDKLAGVITEAILGATRNAPPMTAPAVEAAVSSALEEFHETVPVVVEDEVPPVAPVAEPAVTDLVTDASGVTTKPPLEVPDSPVPPIDLTATEPREIEVEVGLEFPIGDDLWEVTAIRGKNVMAENSTGESKKLTIDEVKAILA